MATVLIGADICPIEGNRPYFEAGDARRLFTDLLPEFETADLCVANLECPLIEQPTPIFKTGPVFGEAPACIKGIKAAGINVLNLANNHILDHGPAGLRTTLDACAQAGVATVGAGENLAAARRIFVREVGGVRIGILSVAEHEFSIATEETPGANPLNLIDFVRNVREHKQDCDFLLVLFHGGDEFLVPSPRVKDTCHFMVEMGADAVIVQHPHVLGGYEHYRGAPIVYGQGALLMDEAIYRERKSFHEGFLVKLHLSREAGASMELVPFVQSDPAPGARRLTPPQEQEFRRVLDQKAKAVANDALVREQWVGFCERNRHSYLSGLLGHNRILRKLNAKGWLERVLHGKRPLLGTRNIVICETHREVIETLFSQPPLPS